MGDLANVFATFGGDPRLHIASFSIDPEQDTPPVLTAYAAERGIASPHWHLLTGELPVIEKFSVEGLRIGTLEEPLTHSQHVVLVDGLGTCGYYDGLDPWRFAASPKMRMSCSPSPCHRRGSLAREPRPARPHPRPHPHRLPQPSEHGAARGLDRHPPRPTRRRHRRIMLGALATSAAFLAVYLTHHALSGSTHYPFRDWTYTAYLLILIPHSILAGLMVPFILRGVWLAWQARFDAHKRLMR